MAKIYEYKDGIYQLRNEYEMDDLTVSQVVEHIENITCNDTLTYHEDAIGYGDGAIRITDNGDDWLIIAQ